MADVQLPIAALTILGIVLAVLGLLVAGNIAMVLIGLGAIAFAGLLGLSATRRA